MPKKGSALDGRQETRLETAAAATAEAATGATASRKPGAARTAGRGGHDAAGARRHVAQIVGEGHGVESRAERGAAIPLRRLGHDPLEGATPVFLDTECHGERQKFLEHFGGLDHAIEPVGFDVYEKI